MMDGNLAAQTFKIDPQRMDNQNLSLNFDVGQAKRRTTLDDNRRSMPNEPSSKMVQASGQPVRKSVEIEDQANSPPSRGDTRGKMSRSQAKEVPRVRLNTDSSSPEHNLMVNQTRDTSMFHTVQHSKDISKQQTPNAELKSEPAMSKRSTARKDTFRQLQFENEKLKTCIDFLVQGGDWNELVQMFGEADPTLKDIMENYLSKSSQHD